MTDVFFKGYGSWTYAKLLSEYSAGDPVIKPNHFTSGIFRLAPEDEKEYKSSSSVTEPKRLLANYSHPDSPFLSLDLQNRAEALGYEFIHIDNLRFIIDWSRSPKPILKVVEQAEINTESDKIILEGAQVQELINSHLRSRRDEKLFNHYVIEKAKINTELGQTVLVSAQHEPFNSAKKAGRRSQQIDKILDIIKMLGCDPLQIPEGTKQLIKKECLKDGALFTPDGFKEAWKEANRRELISMQDKEKYLKNQ